MENRGSRIAMLVIGVPNVITGLWAVVDPKGWYEDFPGWAPRLVASVPPFNEHLAADAGAGLLASGVVAVLAAWWNRRDVTVVAMTAYLAFALPHALWHLTNPADLLSGGEDMVNTGTLLAAVVIAAGVLWSTLLADPGRAATEASEPEPEPRLPS